jgi:hypothetical protein
MLVPSKGMDIAVGICKTCRKPYHRNYRTCTFTDAAEEHLFVEIFSLTRNYCSNKCLPKPIQRKVTQLANELPARKQALKDFRMEKSGFEVL